MTREEIITTLKDLIVAKYDDDNIFLPLETRKALSEAVEMLSHKELPANLDEACQKISEECYDGYFSGYQESHRMAARMGVEWMAGQGETIEDVVGACQDADMTPLVEVCPKTFKLGDKVIIQIRRAK